MAVLVINCGTATVKISLFDKKLNLLGTEKASNATTIESLLEKFDLSKIKAIGHRVVHGGNHSIGSQILTPQLENELRELSDLAPLHNPPTIRAIDRCKALFPHLPQIVVFDTSFHRTMPQVASYYAIPWVLTQKYQIRRFGFHGIAHAFSWKKYSEVCGEKKKVISLHLGSGCSLAAISEGKSMDTSMGYSPLDGIMMATRSGELDPTIIEFLCKKENKTPEEILSLLNHNSGLLGVSSLSGDMRQLNTSNDPQAHLAKEMFAYQIIKKVGAFLAVLKGADALIFSGGIGENDPFLRKKIAEALSWLGVDLAEDTNQSCTGMKAGEMKMITKIESRIPFFVVGSDENLFIAKEMVALLP